MKYIRSKSMLKANEDFLSAFLNDCKEIKKNDLSIDISNYSPCVSLEHIRFLPDTHSFFSNFPRVIPSAKSETHFPKSVQGAQFIYNEIANAFCMPSLLKTFYDSVFDSKNETDLAAIISPFSLALSPQDFIKQTQYGLKHLKSPLDYFLDLPDEKAFPICNAFITDPKTYDWGPFFLAYMGYDVCAKNTFTFDSALTGTIKTDTLMKRFLSKAGKTPPAERHRGAPNYYFRKASPQNLYQVTLAFITLLWLYACNVLEKHFTYKGIGNSTRQLLTFDILKDYLDEDNTINPTHKKDNKLPPMNIYRQKIVQNFLLFEYYTGLLSAYYGKKLLSSVKSCFTTAPEEADLMVLRSIVKTVQWYHPLVVFDSLDIWGTYSIPSNSKAKGIHVVTVSMLAECLCYEKRLSLPQNAEDAFKSFPSKEQLLGEEYFKLVDAIEMLRFENKRLRKRLRFNADEVTSQNEIVVDRSANRYVINKDRKIISAYFKLGHSILNYIYKQSKLFNYNSVSVQTMINYLSPLFTTQAKLFDYGSNPDNGNSLEHLFFLLDEYQKSILDTLLSDDGFYKCSKRMFAICKFGTSLYPPDDRMNKEKKQQRFIKINETKRKLQLVIDNPTEALYIKWNCGEKVKIRDNTLTTKHYDITFPNQEKLKQLQEDLDIKFLRMVILEDDSLFNEQKSSSKVIQFAREILEYYS